MIATKLHISLKWSCLNFHQKAVNVLMAKNYIVSQHRNYVIQSNFSSQSSQPATIQHMHPVLEYALTIL